MTLTELLHDLESFAHDLTIYASKDTGWSPESTATAALEPEAGGVPDEAPGLTYLLEVSLAKDVIETWEKWHGRPASPKQKAEAVIYYAKNDAYMP